MTDLANNNNSASDLTAYNCDGLELFFTLARKVRATQSALVRMCGHDNDVRVRRFLAALVNSGTILDVVTAQVPTANGLRSSSLHNSSTIKVVLKEFKPELLEQFLDFGIDEGLAQMAGVPLPQAQVLPVELNQEQRLGILAEAAIKFGKLADAAAKNPGDVRQMEAVLADNQLVLDGTGSIFDMAEANGIELNTKQSRAVGMIMAGICKGRKEIPTFPQERRRFKNAKGKYQSYLVNVYPLSMVPSFLSAYAATAEI